MKRQEAINVLTCGLAEVEWVYPMEYATALDMAIEALEHEQERQEDIYECPNCIGEVHKNYIYCPFCGIKVGE